jgi:hypothetical protein
MFIISLLVLKLLDPEGNIMLFAFASSVLIIVSTRISSLSFVSLSALIPHT